MNAIAAFKSVKIKNNASEWFDGETAEKIHTRDKMYKKYKSIKKKKRKHTLRKN